MSLKDYFTPPNCDNSSYIFKFIEIKTSKHFDKTLIDELSKELLLSYSDKRAYEIQFENDTDEDIKKYICNKFPSPDPNNPRDIIRNVRKGDFGELFCRLICEYYYNKTCYNKFKYKFNFDRSTFGTDVVSFDNINNPTEISYYEVKTREKLEKESPGKGKPSLYISVIAHNSLKKDADNPFNAVLDHMFQRLVEFNKEDEAKIFRDIYKGKKTVNKKYEIFLITENNPKNRKDILDALNTLPPSIPDLSVTIVVIDELSSLIEQTWNALPSKAVDIFGH